MATTVTYKGNEIANFDSGTKTLETAGKYCEDDITVTSTGGDPYQKWRGYIGALSTWASLFNNAGAALTDADLIGLNLTAYSSNKTDLSRMFYGCTAITEVPLMNTSSATNMANMFYYCSNLVRVNGLNTGNSTNLQSLFSGCSKLESIGFTIDASSATNMAYILRTCSKLSGAIYITNSGNVTSMDEAFYSDPYLIEVHIDDTSKVTNFSQTFAWNNRLETVETLDFSSATTNLTNAFPGCGGLKNVVVVPNTIKRNIGFPNSSNLTNASLISIANGLNESVSGQTLTLHTTPKALLDSIRGTADNSSGKWIFTENAQGTVTLQDFIQNTKGWSIV